MVWADAVGLTNVGGGIAARLADHVHTSGDGGGAVLVNGDGIGAVGFRFVANERVDAATRPAGKAGGANSIGGLVIHADGEIARWHVRKHRLGAQRLPEPYRQEKNTKLCATC